MSDAANIGAGPMVYMPQSDIALTMPNNQLCHYIRDDELERLSEMRRDLIMEICLTSIGIFIGSLTAGIDGFRRFNVAVEQLTATDLISMLILFAAGVVALITGLQWRVRARRHGSMVDEIRARPKVAVGVAMPAE